MGELEFQAKSDRELLILTASQVNNMDEKLDSICGILNKHDEKLEEIDKRVSISEEQIHSNKKILWGIIGGIIAIVSGIVTVVLKHIGLS